MREDGKPEIGDTLITAEHNSSEHSGRCEVMAVDDHAFAPDEYLVQYPDGFDEIVTGHRIMEVFPFKVRRKNG